MLIELLLREVHLLAHHSVHLIDFIALCKIELYLVDVDLILFQISHHAANVPALQQHVASVFGHPLIHGVLLVLISKLMQLRQIHYFFHLICLFVTNIDILLPAFELVE